MRSDALDLVLESRGGSVWLILAGPFHDEQTPGIREKIHGLILDGHRDIIVNLHAVTHIDTTVVPTFLQLLNTIREKGGDIRFIFSSDAPLKAFAQYKNIFSIYPDAPSLLAGGFMSRIRNTGRILFRKTGLRISRGVAIFLFVILGGWFASLGFIISLQNQRIQSQLAEINDLTQWKTQTTLELTALRERLKPIEQLGLLPEGLSRPPAYDPPAPKPLVIPAPASTLSGTPVHVDSATPPATPALGDPDSSR